MASGIGNLHLTWTLRTLIVAAAAIVSAAVISLSYPLLHRFALARPNARSAHKAPTPQGGGIGIVTAVLAVTTAAITITEPASIERLLPVFGAAILLAVVGAIDDVRALNALTRLLVQAAAVAVVLASIPRDFQIFPVLEWWQERSLLLIAGIWFVNLVNFMDGIDWMTVVEVLPITVGVVLVGMVGQVPSSVTIVALALAGAVIGFAPFNRPVARLFLGDVGSLPIGLLVGWMLMMLAINGHIAAAVILPFYYLADATITVSRRASGKEKIWAAHRSHFYQRALDNGLTVPAIIARVGMSNFALVVLATTSAAAPGPLAISLTLAAAILLTAALLYELSRKH